MAKLLVTLGLLLIVAIVGTRASKLLPHVKVDVVSSQEMKDILTNYPNAVELKRKVQPATLASKEGASPALAQPHLLIEYYIGGRVLGDFLVGRDQQSHSWGTPQDIEMRVSYPADGGTNGYIVSYVSIVVRQSDYGGKAYVVWGGIGYRYIRIVVEAYQTHIFDHDANIYGY